MARSTSDAEKGSDAIADLAEQARQELIGSIDYFANAKAIALNNPDVQSSISELLDRGYRLVAIEPLRGFGSLLMSYPLIIVFRPAPDSGPVALDEALTVLVELPTRSVKRATRSTNLPSVHDVPFAIAATARSEPRITPMADVAARYQREADFYRGIGLGMSPGASSTDETVTFKTDSTPTTSDSGSNSFCQGVADDTTVDDDDMDDWDDQTHQVTDHHDDDASQAYPGPGRWPGGPPWAGGGPGGLPGPGGGWPWPDPQPPSVWRRRRA